MALYDLMLLLDPTAPSERQEQILGETRSMIESGGAIVGGYDWGERRIAFPIRHRDDAHYHLLQVETDPGSGVLERLDHQLKITDGVLRFRMIRLKDGAPPVSTPPQERPPRERRENGRERREDARGRRDEARAGS
jgi:small subunit ribosomal protein S6